MKSINHASLRVGLVIVVSLLLALPARLAADWEPNAAFGLGEAGRFAVLSLGKPTADTDGQSKLDLSAVTVHGDVGVGPYGTLDFQGPSTIEGDLYLDVTLLHQDILSDEGTVTGERLTVDLAAAVNDALSAAATNAALPPTQTLDRVSQSMTLYGQGGLNVIAMEGLDYSRSSPTTPMQLTLKGSPDDLFVLNIKGKFVMGSNASIRGVDPSQVLINVLPGKTPAQFAANSYLGGTLLATERKMGPLQGASGPVIGARVAEISLVGGAVLNPPPTAPVAVILCDQTVTVDSPAQLDGSASTAAYGAPLIYAWEMLDAPDGSLAALSEPTAVAPYFIPDVPGMYLVQLIVHDGDEYSEPAVTEIVASLPGDGADLALYITDTPDPVVAKTTVAYVLHIDNHSERDAADVRLTAALLGDARGTPIAEPAASCVCSTDGLISCALGQVLANGSAEVTVHAIPKRPGTFGIEGEISADGTDPNPADNVAVEETAVIR